MIQKYVPFQFTTLNNNGLQQFQSSGESKCYFAKPATTVT